MTNITPINVQLGMDASAFAQGTELARSEVAKVKQIMRDSVPAAEKYQNEVNLLNKTFSESGRQSKEYTQAMEHLRRKYKQTESDSQSFADRLRNLKFDREGIAGFAESLGGSKLGGAAVKITAIAAAVAVVAVSAKKAFDAIREWQLEIGRTANEAKRLGVTYQELAGMRFVSEQLTGSGDEFIDFYSDLKIKAQEALAGEQGAVDIFDRVGLDAADASVNDMLTTIKMLSGELRNLPKPEQLYILDMIGGDSAKEQVELLTKSNLELDGMLRRYDMLNNLTETEVEAIQSANREWAEVGAAIGGFKNRIAADFAGTFEVIANIILGTIKTVQAAYEGFLRIFETKSWNPFDGFFDAESLSSIMSPEISPFPDKLPPGMTAILDEANASEKKKLADKEANLGYIELKRREANKKAYEEQLAILKRQTQELRLGSDEANRRQKYIEIANQFESRKLDIEQTRTLTNELKKLEKLQKDIADRDEVKVIAAKGSEEIAALVNDIDRLKNKDDRDLALVALEKEYHKQLEIHKHNRLAVRTLMDNYKQMVDLIKEKNRLEDEGRRAAEADAARQDAIKAAQEYFEAEREKDKARRDAVSAGPGGAMQVGSQEAAKHRTDQINAAIGGATVPEKPTPGEEKIVKKAAELLAAQQEANRKSEVQLTTMKSMLAELQQNKFGRLR